MVLVEETVEVDDGRGGKAKGWGEREMEEEIEVEKKAEEAREEGETEEGEEVEEREEAIEDDDVMGDVSVPPIAKAGLLVDAARTEDTLFLLADVTLLRVTDNEDEGETRLRAGVGTEIGQNGAAETARRFDAVAAGWGGTGVAEESLDFSSKRLGE